MGWSDIFSREFTRIRIALVLMVAMLMGLCGFLWQLQVFNVRKYQGSVEKQSVRRVRLPGPRGRIFDRNGVALADNRPCYGIAIYIEELKQPGRWEKTVDKVDGVIAELSKILGVEKTATREDIRNHIKSRLYMPFLAWRDVNNSVLARWAESNVKFPGVDIYVEPVRVYPDGPVAAHVLGFVGKANPAKTDPDSDIEAETYHFYLPEMEGKSGIESAFNETLAGVPGGRLICVDASGLKRRDARLVEFERGNKIGERAPHAGKDISLTIDVSIQRLVQQALTNTCGAGVVLDPRNGNILAMVSSPGFDPNLFSTGISKADMKDLETDEKPMFNRAIAASYAPGSVFKPVVVMTALQNAKAMELTAFDCPGYYQLGNVKFHCWCKEGHGVINMRKAIEQSCNSYFCQLGLACGNDLIHATAANLGFGKKTGVELRMESPGILPDDAWKRRVMHDAWRPGDTCNFSIGQGALTVTPLQIAVMLAALSNGGNVYRPRLIKNDGAGELVRTMKWSASALRVLHGGMYDVIQAETGTGKRARIPDVTMAGKTGTAEYGIKGGKKKYGWMTVFAPSENPRYAMVMVVEEAISGGVTIAPRIREVASGIFALEKSVKAMTGAKPPAEGLQRGGQG